MPSTNFQSSVVPTRHRIINYVDPTGLPSSWEQTSELDPRVERRLQRQWVNTPNYREIRVTGGILPDNTFLWSEFTLTRNSSTVIKPTYHANGWYVSEKITYAPLVAVGTYDPGFGMSYSDIASRLINKAKGNQWNVPIFLAECGKTASMVIARATHLARMVNALRRGRFDVFVASFHPTKQKELSEREVKRFNKDFGKNPRQTASNAWLEYAYGWIPFMSDVRNAVNTLMDVVDQPASRQATVRASLRKEIRELSAEERIFIDPGLNVYIRGLYQKEATESLRATWRLSVNPVDLPGRFGLTNPAEVIWELVPFSFVADWFLPIGDYLSALDAPLRFNHLGGTYGRRLQTKQTTIPVRSENTDTFTGFSGSGRLVRVQREKMVSAPSVSASTLVFEAHLNVGRVISSIALLSQQLSRFGR